MSKRKHSHNHARPPIEPDGRGPKRPGAQPVKHGRYWLFGHHPVSMALGNPARDCYRLVATPQALAGLDQTAIRDTHPNLAQESAETRDIDRLVPAGAVHQGLALEVAPLDPLDLDEACAVKTGALNLVLALDQVTDPHNVGAILRSAAAFGARAVITTDRNAPPETGTLAKSASGALDLIPFVRVGNLVQALDRLAELGYWRIGLADGATAPLDELDMGQNLVLVLGAEGAGLRRLTLEHCDVLAHLPTTSAMASLNVSNAAAVGLYELARRQPKVHTGTK